MIIVLGRIVIKDGYIEKALEISRLQVERSRKEPGCIMHSVNLDSENPLRLVFVEKWSDQKALSQHFKELTSLEFLKALEDISTQDPEISIFDATQIR